MRALILLTAITVLGIGSAPAASSQVAGSVRYLEAVQQSDGGFAEGGQPADAALTAWGALALAAGGGSDAARERALAFLRTHERDETGGAALALEVLARAALGDRPDGLARRLRDHRPGTLVNETIWTILALRATEEQVPRSYVKAVLASQHAAGGWSWARRGSPDSNDTAAAIQALRAVGVTGAPIKRALAALRGFQNRDGGFGLVKGRASDVQSTAWAIQAFLAAGAKPGKPAFRYLSRLRRPDGSYRYSTAYGTTPVWVTAQVVPALAGRPFPLAGR